MKSEDAINDFMSHIDAMRSLIAFVTVLPVTMPHVMTVLTEQQRKKIYELCVVPWINFNRELYSKPDMYVDAPTPTPVDPNCSPLEISDHLQERLGKNHPFFDFIHAPLTHPLGTQISLVCINYCWDAYDTFVKKIISGVQEDFPEHRCVRTFQQEDDSHRAKGTSFTTNDRLTVLALDVTEEKFTEFLKSAEPSWTIGYANQLLAVAKALRTIFTHHFGKPDDRLKKLLEQQPLPAIRIEKDRFEVLTPLVRDVCTVVQGQALIIEQRRKETYA